MEKRWLTILLVTIGLTLGACGDDDDNDVTATGGIAAPEPTPSIQPQASPTPEPPVTAACTGLGGQIETLVQTRNQQPEQFCRIERALIGLQTLHRAVALNTPTLATTEFLQSSGVTPDQTPSPAPTPAATPMTTLPNPASVYCVSVRGASITYESPTGQIGICAFSDDSKIEEFTLYYGPRSAGNQTLAQALE